MSLEQLKQELEIKIEEIRNLLKDKKVDEAEKVMQEKRNLEKSIKMLEEVEEQEKRELENQKKKKDEVNKNMENVNEFRAIVKTIMGKETTAEERAVITSSDNAAVLPKEFVNKVQEIQKGYGALKHYCDVIPVFKNEGTIPVVDLDQNNLADVAEGQDIVDGSFATTDIQFTCGKVGLINTLSSELVEDAEVEIEGLIKKNFANIATVKENAKIIKVIADNATEVTGATNYEAIENAIDTTVPSAKLDLVTLTNATGYAYLKNQKDKQGRNLNLITEVNGAEMFHGKPIVVVDDALLTAGEDKTYVFYVVNMKEAVKFCERQGISIARSTEAGFNDDTVKIRILERFGVVKGSARSIKKIEF